MYAQNLAMNHLAGGNQTNIISLHNQLDYPVFMQENLDNIVMIHCYIGCKYLRIHSKVDS
jgi:hypothetical protein